MSQQNRSVLPGVNCCSANLVDQDTYVRELIFAYCSNKCRPCPLANKNPRKMSLEKVKNHIEEVVSIARERKLSRVRIQLIGGDALSAWTDFQKICDLVSRQRWGLPVDLGAVICSRSLSPEKQTWLLENCRKVQLICRWDEETGLAQWKEYPVLRHPMVSCIQWFVTRSSIGRLKPELSMLLRYGKMIQLEFLDLDSWNEEDYRKYFLELSELLLEEVHEHGAQILQQFDMTCPDQCIQRVDTVDIDGKQFRCRYFSPERMISSTRSKCSNQIQWAEGCAAAEELMVRRPAHRKLAHHYEVYLKSLHTVLHE